MNYILCQKIKDLYTKSGDALVEEMKKTILADEELRDVFYETDEADESGFNPREVRSWEKSIPCLIKLLYDNGYGEIYAVLEYSIPNLAERMDVVLVGQGQDCKLQIVIVELKQWDRILTGDELLTALKSLGLSFYPTDVIIPQDRKKTRNHPCGQLITYSKLITQHHNKYQEQPFGVATLGYLHKFPRTHKDDLFNGGYECYRKIYEKKIFVQGEEAELINYLSKYLKKNDCGLSYNDFLIGDYSNSLDTFSKIKDFSKENVALIKGQRKAIVDINKAFRKNENAKDGDKKKIVFLISGGPGSGKTVLALHMFIKYSAARYKGNRTNVMYSTVNRTLQAILSSKFQDTGFPPLTYDVVDKKNKKNKKKWNIVDEAQRLNNVENNLKRLIADSEYLAIFQDDKQIVRPSEQGNKKIIKEIIDKENIDNSIQVVDIQLKDNVRNGSNNDFLSIIDDCLEDGQVPERHYAIKKYIIDTTHTLDEIEEILKNHQKRDKTIRCKWLAPFCWNWSKNININDVVIDSKLNGGKAFLRPWNPYDTREQAKWYECKNPEDLKQIGCVYTSQGLDFDYIGLIWWDDLVWRADKWICYKEKSKDRAFDNENKKNNYGLSDNQVLQLFKNTYRILLTRATKGIYIWFKDPETKAHFIHFTSKILT